MTLKRVAHVRYITRNIILYRHAKYRKWILRGNIPERVKSIFGEVAFNYVLEMGTMKVALGHVHVFLSFPPRYSISKVVEILKSVSPRVIFHGYPHEYPEVKKHLWSGEFWEGGYFARTLGDKVTAEVIKEYIQYHHDQERAFKQLE